ncbi:hypothetical protein [Paeniglutamicibacter terrestris]|uniref:Linalool dehydratase/isomerase domain-containing protein n=1 Tax=Paeniglutamicibacter terrestris TaxID=2723403 RepID=A0ABX1G2X0_9MICC|nr:hypothetical protein [Paeniglutamicibacter terrestris]NKG20592.1 hypothetical protein [Paeniglutamicibacter terrestris]
MTPATETLRTMYDFFVGALHEDELNTLTLHDHELDGTASDCSTIQIAAFFAYMNNIDLAPDGALQAHRLLLSVVQRTKCDDWFRIPYNAPLGGHGAVDLAEFGAAATSAGYLAEHCSEDLGRLLLNSMAEAVEKFENSERAGAYSKNSAATLFDVLNGDLYAALVNVVAYRTCGRTSYLHKASATIRHLIGRFDRETAQWPYSEDWSGGTLVGMSVAYQATITGWGRILIQDLPPVLGKEWSGVLAAAEFELIRQVKLGRDVHNEAPSWVSPWEKVWEIWQAFSLCEENDFTESWTRKGIFDLECGIDELGTDYFIDSRPTRPGRTVLGSRIRTGANVVSVLMSIEEAQRSWQSTT